MIALLPVDRHFEFKAKLYIEASLMFSSGKNCCSISEGNLSDFTQLSGNYPLGTTKESIPWQTCVYCTVMYYTRPGAPQSVPKITSLKIYTQHIGVVCVEKHGCWVITHKGDTEKALLLQSTITFLIYPDLSKNHFVSFSSLPGTAGSLCTAKLQLSVPILCLIFNRSDQPVWPVPFGAVIQIASKILLAKK